MNLDSHVGFLITNKGVKKMKKKIVILAGSAASQLTLLAEGTTPTMDTTQAEAMLTSAQTGLTSLLTSAAPVVTALVLAGLAIWGALMLVRIIKRAFSRAS